jgi:hypothetical protein
MLKKWRTFRQLSGTDQRLLLWTVWVMIMVRVTVRLCSFRWLKKIWIPPPAADEQPQYTRPQLAWAVEMTGKNFAPVRNTCLVKGLTAYYLMSKSGYTVELVNGIRKKDGQFQAHAWVADQEGVWVGDNAELHSYSPIFTLGSVGSNTGNSRPS